MTKITFPAASRSMRYCIVVESFNGFGNDVHALRLSERGYHNRLSKV